VLEELRKDGVCRTPAGTKRLECSLPEALSARIEAIDEERSQGQGHEESEVDEEIIEL
jgi:hypothetical protein